MRKYLLHVLIISLTLLPMLIGCYMYEPVSTMPTWQLQSEYDSLQIERGKLERKLQYGGGGYTSRTYTDTNIWTGEKEIKTKVTPDNSTLYELDIIDDRLIEIQSEMSRRTMRGY